MKNRPGIAVLAASLALTQACGMNEQQPQQASEAPTVQVDAPRTEVSAREDESFDALFQEAGEEFDVPPALLKSISFVQTRYQMVEGAEEFEGRPAVHGMMALTRRAARGGREAGRRHGGAGEDRCALPRPCGGGAAVAPRGCAEGGSEAGGEVGAGGGRGVRHPGRGGPSQLRPQRGLPGGPLGTRDALEGVGREWTGPARGGAEAASPGARRSGLRTGRVAALAQLQLPAHGSEDGGHPHL